MRWQDLRRSSNLQDRRGLPGGRGLIGGGGGLLLVGVVVALLGGDPTAFFVEGINRTIETRTQTSAIPKHEQDQLVDFVGAVLGSTEDVWQRRFASKGAQYTNPQLVVFSGTTGSACGTAQRAMGPFYCPLDQTVYLDLEFFHELATRFQAAGDFAQAYVIAHEIGHHVQHELGILQQTQRLRRSDNSVSVKVELMADCLAGIWAHDTQQALEPGDITEALNAASQIGDDVLQKKTTGRVVPDSFTHGSAADRQKWFKRGYDTGDLAACDTF